MTTTTRRAVALLTCALLLGACGGEPTEPTAADDPAETTTAAEPEPSESPTEPEETDEPGEPGQPTTPKPDTAKNQGDWDLVFTGVRVGHHEGYDRVVLDLDGTGVPGWRVEYVEEALLEGSGRRVDLAGDAILQVFASGTTYPAEGADYYDGPRRLSGAGAVAEVYVGGTFEGYTQLFLGIDGDPADFDVFALDDPARLVLDVQG